MEYIADSFYKQDHTKIEDQQSNIKIEIQKHFSSRPKISKVSSWFSVAADIYGKDLHCAIYFLDDASRIGIKIHQTDKIGINFGLHESLEIYDFDLSYYDPKKIEVYVSNKDYEWATTIAYRDNFKSR